MTNCFNLLSHGRTTFPYVFHKVLKYISLCSKLVFHLTFFVVIVHALKDDFFYCKANICFAPLHLEFQHLAV